MEGERMKKIDIDLLQKMLEPQSSDQIMLESFESLKPTKKEIKKIPVYLLSSIDSGIANWLF